MKEKEEEEIPAIRGNRRKNGYKLTSSPCLDEYLFFLHQTPSSSSNNLVNAFSTNKSSR